MMTETARWLLTVPCGDGNFKSKLDCATAEDIRQALEELNKQYGENAQKAKRAKLIARLKRM